MFGAVLVSAIVSGTVASIVSYKKGYKDGYKKMMVIYQFMLVKTLKQKKSEKEEK